MKKRLRGLARKHGRLWLSGLTIVAALGFLLLWRLGTLVSGMSEREVATLAEPAGFHGIYDNPLNLPLKLAQSVVFFLATDHGQFLSRLPNVLFGALSIASFAWLISFWHNARTTIFTTILFATSAWVLHASRLATFDVMYLWALPTMLLLQVLLHNYGTKAIVWYGSLLTWGMLLYIPGLVWLILAQLVLQRKLLLDGWKNFNAWWQRALSILAVAVWLPLLVVGVTRAGNWLTWLGLPDTWASPLILLKQFAGVFVHLFVRGPQYPDIWLGRLPILDIFTLALCLIGIYFYATHSKSARTKNLGILGGIGILLVAIGGPVGLSLLVPLLYVGVATGVAYLLHDWLKVFPRNPFARGLGIGLIAFAVSISAGYNLRSYFVAWPHNPTTQVTFRYHR